MSQCEYKATLHYLQIKYDYIVAKALLTFFYLLFFSFIFLVLDKRLHIVAKALLTCTQKGDMMMFMVFPPTQTNCTQISEGDSDEKGLTCTP